MIDCSNMTNDEVFRVNGCLPESRIESLLLIEEDFARGNVLNWIDTIKEARSCFPAEDFMDRQIDELQSLAKSLRGNNRQTLFDIIARIQDNLTEQMQSSEYGADELSKIIRENLK